MKYIKNKKTIIIMIAAIVLILLIILLVSTPHPLTYNELCKLYTDELKQNKDQISDYYKKTGTNNISIVSLSNSGLPYLMYITYEKSIDQEVPCIHIVGRNPLYPNAIKKENDLLDYTDEMTYFFDNQEKYYYTYLGKEYNMETIMVDKYIISDSFLYDYDEYITDYSRKSNTIIILSTIPENKLTQIFPSIIEYTPMNYISALNTLKEMIQYK